jgi:hypothetical protein
MDPKWAALNFCAFIVLVAMLYNQVTKRATYRYSSLSSEQGNIRLLRLMPNKDMTACIECQLFNYSLESGQGNHLYEALSYVWGDPKETIPIFIGKRSFNITKNLHLALLRLRNHSMERTLWVDAICINQANEEEKEGQIQSMARIYGQANRVIVWLGKAEDDSNEALETIRSVAEDESANVSNNQKAVLALFQRLWFERIWVRKQTLDSIRRNC